MSATRAEVAAAIAKAWKDDMNITLSGSLDFMLDALENAGVEFARPLAVGEIWERGDAAPEGLVLMDRERDVWRVDGERRAFMAGSVRSVNPDILAGEYGPLRVIHVPEVATDGR